MKKIISNKNNQFYLFLIIIVCAIFFRYYNYNFQDFWWDELMEFSTTDPWKIVCFKLEIHIKRILGKRARNSSCEIAINN